MEFKKDNDDDGSENVEDSISSNDDNSSASNNNILFNIDIKLSDTKTAKLYINENDDIDEKIKNFCEEYKIKPQLRLMIKKIVENKLNQELSAQKNSSTASSSKQIIANNETFGNKSDIINSFNKEYSTLENRNTENIIKQNEPKDNLRKKDNNKNNRNININKVSLINNQKKHKSINEAVKKRNNLIKYKTNVVKNNSNNKNNRFDNNTMIKKNKDIYKPKKINIIEVKNKELIKKRPNSTENNLNLKKKEYGGVRLYNNFMNCSPIKNSVLQNKYKEKEKKYSRFTPEINKKSKKIYERSTHLLPNRKVEDRLIDYGKKLNQKLLSKKTNILLQDIKDNTFTPQIDNFSRYIAENMKSERINKLMKESDILVVNNNNNNNNNNKKIKTKTKINLYKPFKKSQTSNNSKDEINTFVSFGDNSNISHNNNYKESYILTENNTSIYNPSKNIFDCLYLESKIDRIKKEKKINKQLNDRCTFRPIISNLAKELKKENKETQKQFIERINSTNKKEKMKIKKEENEKHNFKPKITRGPINGKRREINENLEGFYDKRIIIQKEMLENDEIKNNNEKKKYYKQKSSELIMKMKYKLLFEYLDSDKDGLISYDKIKLTGINNDILTRIKPILGELFETHKTFDLKTFCDKIHNLSKE